MTMTAFPPPSLITPRVVLTAEAFEVFADLPENHDKILELIAGEVYEVPSNAYSSMIASRINRRLGNFVEDNNLGFITGEAGGYRVATDRYAPDVAYVSFARQKEPDRRGYNSIAPDLAIEIEDPVTPQSAQRLASKLSRYNTTNTTVWVIYPETRTVQVHAPHQEVKTLALGDTLDGGEALPGFTLAVKDIFPPQ